MTLQPIEGCHGNAANASDRRCNRIPDTPQTRRWVSIHESGHAVACVLCSISFTSVTIDLANMDRCHNGRVAGVRANRDQIQELITTGCAGQMANVMAVYEYGCFNDFDFLGRDAEWWIAGSGSGDVERMMATLQGPVGLSLIDADAFIRAHQAITQALVVYAWPAIEKVAEALAAKGVLSHSEVKRITDRALTRAGKAVCIPSEVEVYRPRVARREGVRV